MELGPQVLFVQGPPGAGKDAFGAMLRDLIVGSVVVKFAEILKNRTHALYGLFDKYGFLPHHAYDATKDEPSEDFLGKTPRQAYIAVSETYFKPQHGQTVFGDMLVGDLVRRFGAVSDRIFIITDSGFVQESMPVRDHFGDKGCYVIQLERPGKDFSSDSRGYWELRDRTIRIVNDGTIEDLREKAQALVSTLYTHLGDRNDPEPSSCFGPRPGSTR